MRLTLWTDYALRTLMYVGANEGRLATIAEIAATFAVSKAHLMKVVNKLARLGYLETVRGKSGGVRLGRSPEEIGVGAVVRDTEEELAVMGCLSDSGFCRLDGCCVLKCALREATLAFLRDARPLHPRRPAGAQAALADRLGLAPDGEARGAAL